MISEDLINRYYSVLAPNALTTALRSEAMGLLAQTGGVLIGLCLFYTYYVLFRPTNFLTTLTNTDTKVCISWPLCSSFSPVIIQ